MHSRYIDVTNNSSYDANNDELWQGFFIFLFCFISLSLILFCFLATFEWENKTNVTLQITPFTHIIYKQKIKKKKTITNCTKFVYSTTIKRTLFIIINVNIIYIINILISVYSYLSIFFFILPGTIIVLYNLN